MRHTQLTPIFCAVWITMGLAAPSYAQSVAAPAASSTNIEADDVALDEVSVIGSVDELQSLDFYAPNSSAVLTRDDLNAQGARKIDQALQYQAGILAEPFGGDNKVEWFKIRGFDASVSLDGTPTTPNGYFVWKPEVFGVESIEILKGPNSLVFGASETGGVVNLVTKRPRKEQALQFNAEAGNRGRLGLSADYSSGTNEAGNVYYRIVTQARREDGLQRETNMKSYYLAPSATIDFNSRTSLTMLTSVQREDGRPTNGFLPAYGTIIDTPYGMIDRRLNAGEPGMDRLKRTQVSAGWTLSHQITDDWKFSQNYKYSRLDLDQFNVFAYGSDGNRELLRGYTYTDGKTNNHYIDNRVSGKWRLADGIEALPTIGFDYLKSDTSGLNNGFGLVPNLDMFNPTYGAPFTVSGTSYDLNSTQWGLYAATQVRVGSNWNFNAGIRHDRAKNNGMINGADSSYKVNHNSVNVGAIYISDFGVSPYISYSESFKPIAGVDGQGRAYKPYEGKQSELGLKLEPMWLNGTVTLAYFDVKEKNALISDASNIQTQTGKRKNRGVELQGDINLTPTTALKAAYTRNRSRQDITTDQTVRTPLIPDNQASAWLSHRFDLDNGQKLTVAGGVRYNGKTVDERYYPGASIKSFTLLDLMVRYDLSREWALQLNARNLSDKKYVSGCDFYCYYGNGRTVDMQLQYQWK